MGKMKEAALSYARDRGWPVFPVGLDKRPLTAHGVLDATLNEDQIKRWWTKWPEANIAIHPAGAGLAVIDLDPGWTDDALDQYLPDLPDTELQAETPRGGLHLFYSLGNDDTVPSRNSVIEHVDVKSFHGYVLVAPSRTEAGHYKWIDGPDAKAHHMDQGSIKTLSAGSRERSEDSDTWLIEPDMPEHIAEAIQWLAGNGKRPCAIAVQGQGGDSTAYATAAMLKGFALTPDTAFELMLDHWNPRCNPPWGQDELDHLRAKVDHAYRYNTSPPGNMTDAYHEAKRKIAFKPVEKRFEEDDDARELKSGRFIFTNAAALKLIPEPTWLVPDLIQDQTYNILFGASQAFKSFIALDLALSIATGNPQDEEIPSMWPELEQGRVLFAVGEGRPGIHQRVRAWQAHYDLEIDPDHFILGAPVPNIGDELEPFVDGAKSMSPEGYKLVVVDTIGRALQGHDENKQEVASGFTAMVEAIISELGCAVLAIHHTGNSADARERGSSVFGADADGRIMARRVPDQYATELQVVKQKDGVSWDQPRLIFLDEIELGSERTSLVARPPAKTMKDKERLKQIDNAPSNNSGRANAVKAQVKAQHMKELDELVADIVHDFGSKEWGRGELAEHCLRTAAQEELDGHERPIAEWTSSGYIEKRITELTTDPATRTAKCFDPRKRVFRGPR